MILQPPGDDPRIETLERSRPRPGEEPPSPLAREHALLVLRAFDAAGFPIDLLFKTPERPSGIVFRLAEGGYGFFCDQSFDCLDPAQWRFGTLACHNDGRIRASVHDNSGNQAPWGVPAEADAIREAVARIRRVVDVETPAAR